MSSRDFTPRFCAPGVSRASAEEERWTGPMALAEATRGRVFFPGGEDLDRFVLWDYVRQRRRIIA